MIVRITRDICFGGVVRLHAGAARVVGEDDFATNAWDANGNPIGKALFVPVNVTLPDAGYVALEAGDYEVLPVVVGTVG